MRIALVMHSPLGAAFNDCAAHILGKDQGIQYFDILPDSDPAEESRKIYEWITQADNDQPVMVLCDLFGATPFNIASKAYGMAREKGYKIELFTGANLCMMLKALTDTSDSTETLIEKIYQSAQRGIVKVETP